MAWIITFAGLVQPGLRIQIGDYTESGNEVALVMPDFDWRAAQKFGFISAEISADIFGTGNPLIIYSEPVYYATQRFVLPIVDVSHRIYFALHPYIRSPLAVNLAVRVPD